MDQVKIQKNLWNAAGKAGLVLGAISTIYLFAGQFLSGDLEPAVLWQKVVAIILWITKVVACIYLMWFFMRRFAKENKVADRKTIYRMGMATAFLSALMFSAIYLANMLYISADFYDRIFQTTIQQMVPMLDSNSINAMEKVIDILPQIAFFYYLLYCYLFGTVLSAIISRYIVSEQQSSEYKPDEE